MTEDEKQEIKDQFLESYEKRKARLQASEPHRRWKGLTGSQRMFIGAFVVFAIIAIAMLIANYWDVPQLPAPSGEGG